MRPGNGFEPDPRIDFYHKTEVNGKNEDEMYKFLKVRFHFKDVLHRYLCIAFMFNGGQLPALTINPIDTRICMVHLYYQG